MERHRVVGAGLEDDSNVFANKSNLVSFTSTRQYYPSIPVNLMGSVFSPAASLVGG